MSYTYKFSDYGDEWTETEIFKRIVALFGSYSLDQEFKKLRGDLVFMRKLEKRSQRVTNKLCRNLREMFRNSLSSLVGA